MIDPISPMLRLFRDGATSYQPAIEELAFESGDPQVSLDNLQRIIDSGLVIAEFMVRPTGVLVLFASGEQYYAPGLRVGTSSLATEARQACRSGGLWSRGAHLDFYRNLPETYKGKLPD